MTETSARARAAALAADPRWRWVVPTALTLLAAGLLLARLGEPARIIFDETYYVNDARQYLQLMVEDSFAVHPPVGKWLIALGIAVVGDDALGWRVAGALAGTLTVLLTYLIGLRLFRHIGYAALAALLLLTDGLFFVQARTSMLDIFLGTFVALGAYLLVLDHDHSGLGRDPDTLRTRSTATAAAGSTDSPAAPSDGLRRLPRRGHVLRLLAGLSFGLAIATKWSGLFALAAAGLLSLGWELLHRRRWTGRFLVDLRPAIASITIAFVLLPGVVYAVSYVPWLVNYEYSTEGRKECEDEAGVVADPCDVDVVGRVAGLWRYQEAIFRFHDGLEASHPYRAPATTWPVLGRPVVYYWETCSEDRANGVPRTDDETGEVTTPDPCIVEREQAAEIIAVGNPALWWTFILASVVLIGGLVRREHAAVVIATFYAVQFVPWLVVSRPVFFFYMVPVVPFLALGLAYAVSTLGRRRAMAGSFAGAAIGAAVGFGTAVLVTDAVAAETRTAWWLALGAGWVVGAAIGAAIDRGRDHRPPRWTWRLSPAWVGSVVAVLAVALFLYFLPVWTGVPMSDAAVRHRWWLDTWI